MGEIPGLRELRPEPSPAELEAMRRAARRRFVAGTPAQPVRRRWRIPVLAGGLTAAAAATAAAALILTSGPGTVPGQHPTGGHTRSVITTAWTVREDADGTVTIYLRQYADPAGLQQTLRADGINAIVRLVPYALGPLRVPYATCNYAATDAAPRAVQHAVVTIVSPALFIIHPDVMPQGSALFLPFLAGMPATPKNSNTGVLTLGPVVLTNDTVPACVPRTKPLPAFPRSSKR
jgi:hypothetical protein